MTEQTPSGPLASLFSLRGLRAAAALGLVGSLALAASGCDTVAQISFTQRGFNDIQSSGFVPAGGGPEGSVDACRATSGDMTMRFVLTDDARRPIRLGVDQIQNESVELTAQDVSFDQGALFEIPQAETALGDRTGLRESPTCSSTDSCEGAQFTCGVAPSIPDDTDYNACFTGGSVSVAGGSGERVRFVSNVDRSKLYGIAFEVSGSVVGSQPTNTGTPYDPDGRGESYRDQDGDGTGDILVEPGGITAGLESDDGENRVRAMGSVQTTYFATRSAVTDDGRQLGFGAWYFNEEAPQQPVGDSAWFTDRAGVTGAIQSFRGSIREFGPFAGTHAEIYDAGTTIIEDNYTDDAVRALPGGERMLQQGVDKVLVLVVDGPDDTRESPDDLIQAARDNGVRVFVVQYDEALEESVTEKIFDVPDYLITQVQENATCSDDSDCKNFESCREFRGFSSSLDGPTTNVPGDKYCFPQRDVDGRVGPIQDYSLIGCATGGGYTYIQSSAALPRATGWTPYAVEGLWEVDTTSGDIDDLAPDQSLLLQTLFDVTVSGTNITYQFSQVGGRTTGQTDSTVAQTDTRSAVFTAE